MYLAHNWPRSLGFRMISQVIGGPVPYREVFQVLQLYANALCAFVRDITTYEFGALSVQQQPNAGSVSDDDKQALKNIMDQADGVTSFLWMPATAARRQRMATQLEQGCTYGEIGLQLRMLRETMEDELKNLLVLYMPAGQAVHFYAGPFLLGPAVVDRLPQLASDIDEAGKCIGSGRYTATVFHLMRVMEVGVQEFGARMGVSLVDAKGYEKNWHNILEEADKAIKGIPKSDPTKAPLAELSALLSAVKLAWRNEVMHPKDSYTLEEAENVLQSTKAFMSKLVGVL